MNNARLRVCAGCLAAEKERLAHADKLAFLDSLPDWDDGYDGFGSPDYGPIYDVAVKALER